MVAQETPYVRIYRRRTHWQLEANYADDILILESIGLEMPVYQIYHRVRREVGLDTPFTTQDQSLT